MERVIENNSKLNAFVLRALGIPQKTTIKKIIIITDEQEETRPKKKISKWAKFAKEEPGYLEGLSEYIEGCSREIRDNFAFKSELTEEE